MDQTTILPVAEAEGVHLNLMCLIAIGQINDKITLLDKTVMRRFMFVRSAAELHKMPAPFLQQDPPALDVTAFIFDRDGGGIVNPSGSWAQCGPLMEHHGIFPQVNYARSEEEGGDKFVFNFRNTGIFVYGRTPLICAVRALVMKKLSNYVEVPLWLS